MVHQRYAGNGAGTPATGDSGPPKAPAGALLDVVSRLSHDIRTPLGAILGFTDLLLDGAGGPLTPEQRRHLRQIRRSGDRILAIVKDCVKQAKEGPAAP
jgi:two-component system cell cycle sensor histidine kinase PleC